MKVNNVSIYMGDDERILRKSEAEKNELNQNQRKMIDGKAFSAAFDPIAAKREEAKKSAMKLVGDAFAGENQIDNDLSTRREKINALEQDMSNANKSIKEIEDGSAELREKYGVASDSQDEQELKLLEKGVKAEIPGSDVRLTEDEKQRIAELKANGLSEYQQRSLEMLESESTYIAAVNEAKQEIEVENQIISATKIERLKSHAMIDATKQAEAIMDEANKEIVGMLVDEAKEHIDKKAQETKEQAEAQKEKEEELQERIDATKEKKKENEELTEDILEGVADAASNASDVNAAQQEIKDMMNKMSLIEDDIKGAAVDKNV